MVQPVKQFVCSASFCQLKNFSQTQLACKPGAEKEEGASAIRPGWRLPAENPGPDMRDRAGDAQTSSGLNVEIKGVK